MVNLLKNWLFLFILVALALQSCAPLSNDYTARTLGKGKWGVSGGGFYIPQQSYDEEDGEYDIDSSGSLYGRVSYGATNNFDLGAVFEWGIVGITAKYAFLNKPEGFSFAFDSSVGLNLIDLEDGLEVYAYGGPILSYKLKWWEPYLSGKINGIGKGNIRDEAAFVYMQYALGNNFWVNSHFSININADLIQSFASDERNFAYFFGTGLVYRF